MQPDGKGLCVFAYQAKIHNPFFIGRIDKRKWGRVKNRSVVVNSIGSFTVEEREIRPCHAGEVLVKVAITGLCRTDLKIIEHGHRDLVLPRVPGEEVVGEIVDKDRSVDVVSIGDVVYVYPGVWCGECAACRCGKFNLCREMKIMGFHRDGGFAQYVYVPAQSVLKVPAGLAFCEAVFAEPLSCCINAIEKKELCSSDKVGIWGAGPAGTLLARLAKCKTEQVTVIEPHADRRMRASGFCSPPDEKFDMIIVATNSRDAYREAFVNLAPGGTLVVFSGLAPGDAVQPLSLDHIHYNEQIVCGAYGCCYHHSVQAIELLATRKIVVDDLISDTLSLWELDAGLTIVKNKTGMKVLLDPWKVDTIK